MNKHHNCAIKKLLVTLPILLLLMGASIARDPTRPPDAAPGTNETAASSGQAANSLTAIFDYPNHRTAIINNQVMRVGDHIDDFTITTITPYNVELTGPDNTKQVLELVSPVKEPAY